jgi:hydrogenase expression/formation protein HypD
MGGNGAIAAALGRLRRAAGSAAARRIASARGAVRLMEVCGGQTRTIARSGLDGLLPEGVAFAHGPGCPVCVTDGEFLRAAGDAALGEGKQVLCTYGDLMRVPDSRGRSLAAVRAAGGDVRVLSSPLEAVRAAEAERDRTVTLLAIGFETTAPANALALAAAAAKKLGNFRMASAQFLLPPVLRRLFGLRGGENDARPDALLAPGHVAAVLGEEPFRALAEELRLPVVVAGFSEEELLRAAATALEAVAKGRETFFANEYAHIVRPGGNPAAREAMERMFSPCDRVWRGLGTIPASGLAPREEYAAWTADFSSAGGGGNGTESGNLCRAGEVLKGLCRPDACPAFGKECTPSHPLGAGMVSPEGACAAYFAAR